MQPSLAGRSRDTANRLAPAWRRIGGAYAIDLLVSLALVLVIVELVGPTPDLGSGSTWMMNLHAAVSRFTPFGLWDIYREEAGAAIAGLGYPTGTDALPNVLLGLQFLLRVLLAAPATLVVIWQQTDSLSDWLTLVGFAVILFGTFGVLAAGGRLTLLRLLAAAVGSPILAVGLFWMTQRTMLDVMNGCEQIGAAALWFLLCPIVCTLYWALFPQAERSATFTLVRAVGQLRPRARHRAQSRLAANVSTTPRTRK